MFRYGSPAEGLRALRSLGLAACATLFTTSSIAGQPARLESVDPLAGPAPGFEVRVADFQTTVRPEEKIVPRLWQRISETSENDEIRVIVELQSPAQSYSQEGKISDVERVRFAAAIEHQFARKAADLITGLRGLSHFPIVFGRVRAGDLEALAASPEVYRVYEDETLTFSRAEGGNLIKANDLRSSAGATGAGVSVAILDSGVDDTHPELAGRIAVVGDYTGGGDATADQVGHGTSVAGIVAGFSGIAPQASLWAIKVGNADGILTSDSLAALNDLFAGRNGVDGSGPLHVINMSFGSRGPFAADCDALTPYNSVLNSLVSAGISAIVSSGNHADGAGIGAPACHSKVIAVGAVYDANLGPAIFENCVDPTTASDQVACYSDSGPPLDVLAPGHCATTTIPGGGHETCFGGTSAAAPYVAGVAAQLLQLHPGLNPSQLRSVLMTTGRPITDVNGITRSRIDALAAHQALSGGGSTGPCVQDSTTACLQNGRFEVKVSWNNATDTGTAAVMGFNGQRAENNDSAFFSFQSPTNFEMGVKMLNACIPLFGNKFWVFVSGLTDQGWQVEVRDTQTGATKTYTNFLGDLSATFADTSAFDC